MPAVLSTEVKNKIVVIISGDAPILSRLTELEELLIKEHLMKVLNVDIGRLKTHKVNRSGLGVNPHEVHRLGGRVAKIGFKMDELDLYVIEEASSAEARMEQQAFNKALISGSAGRLAPLKGSEDLNMVGGNHMVHFLRAVEHGCNTPIKELQDADGQLDKQKLFKKGFAKAFRPEGLPAKVIKQDVEAAVPEIAAFLQKAKNATNSIQSECNELEIMSSIAEFAESGAEISDCVVAAVSSNPPCSNYANVLGDFVKEYGGGKGAPVVHDIDAFAKKHAGNLKLGEEFCRAITDMKTGVLNPCPRVRSSCLLANLISQKSKDGISTLITKADLTKLVGKSMLPQVHMLEQEFETTESIIKQLVATGAIAASLGLDSSMIYRVRSITHIIGKTKGTLLNEEWPDLESITAQLYKDLGQEEPEKAATADNAAQRSLLSLQQVTSPTQIAQGKGFDVDCHVYEKAFGSKHAVYKIESIVDKVVTLKAHSVDGYGDAQNVDLQSLFDKFQVFLGELPKLVPISIIQTKSIHNSDVMIIDNLKVQLFSALQAYHKKHGMADPALHFKLITTPASVVSLKKLNKDKLCIVPVVPLQNITTGSGTVESGATCTLSGKKKCKLSITAPKSYDSKNETGHMHLFFFLLNGKKSEIKSEVNIGVKMVTQGDISIPILTNVKALEEGDELIMFQAKRKAETCVADVEEDEEKTKPKGKAKPK
jgi:hypothetical protein